MQEVYPEIVRSDAQGTLEISYERLIPIMIEAIKEQQAEIESLQAMIYSLDQAPTLKSASSNQTNSLEQDEMENKLFQNVPNPFNNNTVIQYYLEDDTNSAEILVYDMTGKQLKRFNIIGEKNGKGEINIKGGELGPGMYIYSMISDGRMIGSKYMILTDN